MELQQNNKEIVNRINDGRVREIERAYGNVEVYMARNRKHMWQKKPCERYMNINIHFSLPEYK